MNNDKCKCIVCGRLFDYGDEWSPMLKDNIWKSVISYYNLEEKERSNRELFDYFYDLYRENRGTSLGDEYWDKCGDYNTFICYPCMEQALGRELTIGDLITDDAPINRCFMDMVLKHRV